MKYTLKVFGIIAFIAVIGFSIAGCASLGGSGGGGGSASDEARLAAVPAGDVPANLVGRWFGDSRKRRGDFAFEITADGKFIDEDGDPQYPVHADATHIWFPHPIMGEAAFPAGNERGRTPYRLSGNTLTLPMTVMGMTMELEFFR